MYNPELIQDIVKKLPHQTQIEWAKYAERVRANNSQMNLRTIAEWLHKLSRTLNQITTLDLDSLGNDRKHERRPDCNKRGHLNFHEKSSGNEINQSTSKCLSCSKSCNNVGDCSKFKGLTVDERWKLVMDQKLCRKCLQKHGRHCADIGFRACGVSGCELKHNPLLHNKDRHSNFSFEKSKSKQDAGNSQSNVGHRSHSTAVNAKPSNSHQATAVIPKPSNTHQVNSEAELFRIVPIILHNNGISVKTFAFLDEGSSYTLMEKETAKQLNVEGTAETICLLWTSGIHRQEETIKVNVKISGLHDTDVKHQLRSVNVVEDLGLTPQSVDPEMLERKFKHLRGLPLNKYTNAIPTILIGLRHIRLSTPLETIEGNENEPIASRSRLGWSVYGPIDGVAAFSYANHHKVSKCPCSDRDDDLHKIVKDHFTIENFGVSINSMNMESKENEKALEMLKKRYNSKGKSLRNEVALEKRSVRAPG